ncbi:MAG TPA: DUF177 domain-containing protein [Candidatus Sumerlaeota bacterium]|nr:DUF177 domain-containing protein [Candidatus Sumerlaeota bacterium]HOR27012.1 DUF177 domain-containing protein [Candidatus Sumerlaeota bacterium]
MPSDLKLLVDRLRDQPLDLELDLDPRQLQLVDEEFDFTDRVRGRLTFRMAGADILAQGDLTARIMGRCVRCLGPAAAEIHVPVTEVWMHGPGRDERGIAADADDLDLTRFYTGEEIELAEPLRELIMAELPDRLYCDPDCKGLCPGCGANLNTEPCACSPDVRRQREAGREPDWKQALKNLHLGDSGGSERT